jgi:hypothetical protein
LRLPLFDTLSKRGCTRFTLPKPLLLPTFHPRSVLRRRIRTLTKSISVRHRICTIGHASVRPSPARSKSKRRLPRSTGQTLDYALNLAESPAYVPHHWTCIPSAFSRHGMPELALHSKHLFRGLAARASIVSPEGSRWTIAMQLRWTTVAQPAQ